MFLLYPPHPSDSFLLSSLLFSCSVSKCTCPKFNCNSYDIGSLLRELNLELILFLLTLIPPALSSLFFSTLLLFILPFSFQLFCFSSTFSILLILSFSLLYSFHVVSLSALARSLTVIVDIGSLLRELNLELILFLLTLIPPALSSLFFSTLLLFILPFSFQLVCFSSTFSILLILSFSLLYSFHVVSLSALARSLTVIVDIGSLLRELNLELILFLLTLIPPALHSLFFSTLLVYIRPFSFQLSCFSFTFSILLILALSLLYYFHVVSLSAIARSLTVIVDIGSLLRELNLALILFILALIPPALSSLFFSTLLLFILPFSFQLFCFSSTFSILLILSFSLLYSFHVVSLSTLARSLTVIVMI